MMGGDGLRKASEISLLSANWLAHKIDDSLKYYIKERMVESHMSVYLMFDLCLLLQKMLQRD